MLLQAAVTQLSVVHVNRKKDENGRDTVGKKGFGGRGQERVVCVCACVCENIIKAHYILCEIVKD